MNTTIPFKNVDEECCASIRNALLFREASVRLDADGNLLSLSVLSEGFYRELLNKLMDWHLVSANLEMRNAPGIDLIDNEKRIAVQVSLTCDHEKVQSSIDKFKTDGGEDWRFYFVPIKTDYPNFRRGFTLPEWVAFDQASDILSINRIMDIVRQDAGIAKQREIKALLDLYTKDLTNNTERAIVSRERITHDHIGHCIKFGMTCCRVFRIFRVEEEPLKEINPIRYSVDVPDSRNRQACNAFLEDVIQITNNELGFIKDSNRFVKVLADAEFVDLFSSQKEIDNFVERYYQNTGYYFNIMSKEQTEDNMKVLFPGLENDTVIVDICSTCVHVVLKTKKGFKSFMLKISNQDIKSLYSEEKTAVLSLNYIKTFVKQKIGNTFRTYKANKAIIIKDELSFMQKMGYQLRANGTDYYISFDDYVSNNRKNFYQKDFEERVKIAYKDADDNTLKKYYGFKEGHIILETIFEILEVSTICPTNVPNILRSPLANVFNVVLSGSTKPNHIHYMHEANRIFTEVLKVNVSSPMSGTIAEMSRDSYLLHRKALKECDLLFVCNGDGYIGQQTKCDIYGASLSSKPIAYWCNPNNDDAQSDEFNYTKYIPHDLFQGLMNEYYREPASEKSEITLKGCIIGSFRKYYKEITVAIAEFNKSGIEILSPMVSQIINPDERFVLLATDDKNMSEYEIQSQVFENARKSDFVYVWDPDGYVGRTTCYEIGRIIEKGIPIFYKERPMDIPLEIADERIVTVAEIIYCFNSTGKLPNSY